MLFKNKKKTDILFLCQFFYPENNSSATLPFDTAREMSAKGFKVSALCGYPKEYYFKEKVPRKETIKGVSIRRLRYIQADRKGKLGRLINYFSFTVAVFLHLHVIRNCRSVIVFSNPPILPLVAVLAKKLFGTKIVFVSYDVYPEVALAFSTLKKNGLAEKTMKIINDSLFRNASAVIALTEEMRQYLIEHRPTAFEERIIVIPNWAHENKAEYKESCRKEFGFQEDDFVVSYLGNLGVCQNVETLVQAIQHLKDEKQVRFLIAGHGNKMDMIRDLQKENPALTLYGFLEGEAFEKAVAASDCGIVSLEKGLKGMVAPSKYYSYLQGGLAVIAITEQDSYIAREVVSEQIGAWAEVGDGDALTKILLSLSKDKEARKQMSSRAEVLYNNNYAMRNGIDKYSQLFNALLKSSDSEQNGSS